MKVPQTNTISDIPEENLMKRLNAEAAISETSDQKKMGFKVSRWLYRNVYGHLDKNEGFSPYFSAGKDNFPRELQDDRLPAAGLGAMPTPSRSLTVDNTIKSHYPPAQNGICTSTTISIRKGLRKFYFEFTIQWLKFGIKIKAFYLPIKVFILIFN